MRRPRFGIVSLLAASLGLSFAVVGVASSCASSGDGGRLARGDADAPAVLPTLDDVVRLELERATPRAFEDALHPANPVEVRARAALALARLEQRGAAPLLFRAAKDSAPEVRRHAAFGLGQLDLAFAPGREMHDDTRRGVEDLLVGWYGRETDGSVRVAIVRALGRVSTGAGLSFLTSLAEKGEARADALYALGVSGARRAASLSSDAALLSAVTTALADKDVRVRRAAAYAAFRQKLPLASSVLARASSEPDEETRIHLARAMQAALVDPAPALGLLGDADWRVRVEAIRALLAQGKRAGSLSVDAIAKAGEAAVTRWVAEGGVSGEGHVVLAACDALSEPTLPLTSDDARPAVLSILRALSSAPERVAPKLEAARCRCAVAADGLASRASFIEECAPSRGDEHLRLLKVEVASRARVSSRERMVWLSRAIADPAVPVRVRAAFALLEDGSVHAARLAAKRLEVEEDPAVAGALLMLFEGELAKEIDDIALARVVDRFYTAPSLEGLEPLLQAASLLRGRASGAATSAADRLRTHPEPRLRDLVDGIPHGERLPGARARATPPKAPKDLPLAAILHTERGAIHLAFEREAAPLAVDSFATLARAGFYDGLTFHRVVSSFVAQGGDPRGDGSGGPGYHLPCENHDQRYERGAVGMALAGKDTGGSQFFLTHGEQPHLDGRYTIFARVVSGLDVMDALLPGDRILSVQFAGAVPARDAAR